jgi:hypothetical protein
MEKIKNEIENNLKSLRKKILNFQSYGRHDFGSIYSMYSSEFISLIDYLERTPLPKIFKEKELEDFLNKINDTLKDLEKIFICYKELEGRKDLLNNDFNIVDKSTILYHHLEDLVASMEMYLGFDQTGKYKALEGFFDKILLDIQEKKQSKKRSFDKTLTNLKISLENSLFEEKRDLKDNIELLIEDFNSSGSADERKIFEIKHEIHLRTRSYRKLHLQKEIIKKIRKRLFGFKNEKQQALLENDFEAELKKIKAEAFAMKFS